MVYALRLKNAGYSLCLLVFLLLISIRPVFSSEAGLNHILLPFRNLSYVHFTYTETRHSIFFKQAQQSSGEITFRKPDVVIKQVILPHKKRYEINRQLLTISYYDETSKQNKITQLELDNYPQLQQFVELIKAILSGNSQLIREHYTCSIDTQDEDWVLELFPINKLDGVGIEQQTLKSISIRGRNDQLESIKMTGFGGEASELKIENIIQKN